MSKLRAFLSATRGALAVQFAIVFGAAAMFVAVVANLSLTYLEKRKLQSAADLAALELLSSGPVTPERVRNILLSKGFDLTDVTIGVSQGNYDPSRPSSDYNRYQADATPTNAVRVDVSLPVRERLASGWLQNDNRLDLSAVARMQSSASVAMGSRLLRLEDGLSGQLLSALVGYDGAIRAMDYEQLLSVDVELLQALDALNTDLGLTALNYQDVLDSEVSLGAVSSALQVARTDGLTLPAFSVAPEVSSRLVTLNELINHAQFAYMPTDTNDIAEPIMINGGQLLMASAALADSDNQIGLDLDIAGSLAALQLRIGETAQLMRWDLSGSLDSTVETAQTRLRLSLLDGGLLGGIGIEVRLAEASGRVADIVCSNRTVQRVEVQVTTSPSTVTVDLGRLGQLQLDLSNSEVQTVSFSAEEIGNGTVKQARSGLSVDVNDAPLLYRPLVRAVDSLLVDLGLHLAEADIWVNGAECSRPIVVL